MRSPKIKILLILTVIIFIIGYYYKVRAIRGNRREFTHRFHTEIPDHIKFKNHKSTNWGMDPWFCWEISPIDTSFLEKLIKNAQLVKQDPDARTKSPGYYYLVNNHSCWDNSYLEKLTEVYHRHRSGTFYNLGVDRKLNKIYIFYFNT